MPSQYRYTALNSEGKSLSGVMTAPGVVTAKQNLEKLGLKVDKLEEVSPLLTNEPSPKEKFKFLAIDKDGKKIWGSVASANRLSAYETLTSKYKFSLQYIFPENASSTEITAWQNEGVEILKQQLIEKNKTQSAEIEQAISQGQMVITRAHEVLEKDLSFNVRTALEDKIKELQDLMENRQVTPILTKNTELLEIIQKEEFRLSEELKHQDTVSVTSNTLSSLDNIKEDLNLETNLKNTLFNKLLDDLWHFSLWILIFYALYFFLAETSLYLSFPFKKTFATNSLRSPLLFDIALGLVVISLVANSKLQFFRDRFVPGLILLGGGGIVYLTLVLTI